ncbi:MAG: hypothetical protein ABIJ17_01350 [Patescibacteria group bacterium]
MNDEKKSTLTSKINLANRKGKLFLERYVENVIIKSPIEIYWKNEDGSSGIRICGAYKNDGRRCLAPAGKETDHEGIGKCIFHDGTTEGRQGYNYLVAQVSKGTKLGLLLEQSETQEIKINETQNELQFNQALLLFYLQDIIEKKGNELSKDDIKFLKELNDGLVKIKESSARIKGSLKLDTLTVKQFVDQVLSFLLDELAKTGKLTPEELREIMYKMSEKVFAPMTATSMITGNPSILQKVPDALRDMKRIANAEEVN